MKCWLNGKIIDAEQARISPFDRGFLFGDGIYEVIQYFNRVGVGVDLHIERLRKSLIRARFSGFEAQSIVTIAESLLEAGSIDDGIFYVQVTRGVQVPRAHLPKPGLLPTVFAYVLATPPITELVRPREIKCLLLPDNRWRHCDIKSTSLIANVLAAIEGDRQGAPEVILHREGVVTEGSTTNVFVVRHGRLITPPIGAEPSILAGVTRALVIACAREANVPVEERPVQVAELDTADEVFIASTRRLIDAVTRLDERNIGTGGAGPLTVRLFELLRDSIARRCGCSLHSCA